MRVRRDSDERVWGESEWRESEEGLIEIVRRERVR